MDNTVTTATATEATDTATLMAFAEQVVQHFRAERFNTWRDRFVSYVACGTQVRCFSGDRECIVDILRVSYTTKHRDLVKAGPFANGFQDPRFQEAMAERVRNALIMVKP